MVWIRFLPLQVNRSLRWRMAAILLIAAVLLPACTPPGVTVSTGPREETITGRLGGEPRGDAGCAWLETGSGQRVEVEYPNGWHVEFDPVAVFDESGHQVAALGDMIEAEGYFNDVGASLCTPQRSFVAIRVSAGQ